MPTSGSAIFSHADDYQAGLRDTFDLLVVPRRGFQARLTQVELPHIRLLRAQEAAPRVAFVSSPHDSAFITFPTHKDPPLICGGVDLAFGEINFHSSGQRFHQRTTGASRWGSVSVTPAFLMKFGKALAGRNLEPPAIGRIHRPCRTVWTRLLRLHAQAARIAETQPDRLWHPEVARALEQDLIWALVSCLTCNVPERNPAVPRQVAETLVRLEEFLVAHLDRSLQLPEVCSAVGVSEFTLRAYCSRSLGMDPISYLHTRRLNVVRTALLRAVRATTSVAEVARRTGFADPDQFVREYVDAFGEAPFMPR